MTRCSSNCRSKTRPISMTRCTGFIAKPDTLTIRSLKHGVVWDLEEYKKYISSEKPGVSVNPAPARSTPACTATPSSTCSMGCSRSQRASTRFAATTSRTSPSYGATPAGSCSIRCC